MDDRQAYLLEKQHEISMHLLPVTICLVLLGIFGFIGNALTVVFYINRKKTTSSVILIVCLALVDLAVCILIIPSLLEIFYSLTYNQGFVCKLSHFCARWTISGSCAIIWIISIDRYRKICKPFNKQIRVTIVRRLMYAIAIFTFFVSTKNFVTFGSVPIYIHDYNNNITLTGHSCTTHMKDTYRNIVVAFYGVDMFFVIIVLVTLAFTYSNIIYTLVYLGKKRKRRLQNHVIFEEMLKTKLPKVPHRVSSDVSGMTRNTTEISLLNYAIDKKRLSDVIDKCKSTTNNGVCNLNTDTPDVDLEISRTEKLSCVKKSKENNLTVMMLAVSLVYVVCFTPYFMVRIYLRRSADNIDSELSAGIQTLLRLVYMNSVFNPIIYCIFNPQFRKFIKHKLNC